MRMWKEEERNLGSWAGEVDETWVKEQVFRDQGWQKKNKIIFWLFFYFISCA